MQFVLKCPGCGATLRAPHDAAFGAAFGDARCPHCNTIFKVLPPDSVTQQPPAVSQSAAPAAIPSAPSPQLYTRPCLRCGCLIPFNAVLCPRCGFNIHIAHARSPASTPIFARRWRIVHAGLTAIYAGAIGMLLCVCIGGMLVAAMAMNGKHSFDHQVSTVIFITAAFAGGCWLNCTVGQLLCMAAPTETGAKGFAIFAAFCFALNIAANIAIHTSNAISATDAWTIALIATVAATAQGFFFILFIKALATYLDAEVLAQNAQKYLNFNIYVMIVQFICGFIIGFSVAAKGALTCLLLPIVALAIVMLVLGTAVSLLTAVLWFIRLIESTRRLVGSLER